MKSMYNLQVLEKDEKEVKIKGIYLYPIRGIKGLEVPQVEITPSGIRGDRNWVILGMKKGKPGTPLGCA